MTRSPRTIGGILGAIIAIAGAIGLWLFPRAMPTIALHNELTHDIAAQRADSFLRAPTGTAQQAAAISVVVAAALLWAAASFPRRRRVAHPSHTPA